MAKEQIDLMPTLAGAVPPIVAAEPVEDASPVEKRQAPDAARKGFPGEHWLVLVLGAAAWYYTRNDRRWYVRLAGGFLATTLVARAASGRKGLSTVLRYTPLGKGISNCPPCTQERAEREAHRATMR
jgi:hypothetical protein